MTIQVFCTKHRMSKSLFEKLRAAGLGPRVMRLGVGRALRISAASELQWLADRDRPEGTDVRTRSAPTANDRAPRYAGKPDKRAKVGR